MPNRIEPLPLIQSPPASQAGVAFLTSALLPGSGQFYLREERWVPYIAIEAWAWISYANQKSRGRRLERRYRDLAWQVARRIDHPDIRRDTTFPYYEAMSDRRYRESGAFDADERTAGVQPDPDTLSYNGQQWLRAKALFLPGGLAFPSGTTEYRQALAYYEANAIPHGYGWSWGDSNLERESFARLIEDSDDALRGATRSLGFILANHVVSAIDALVTARLRAAAPASPIKVGSELQPVGGTLRLKTTIHLPLGN